MTSPVSAFFRGAKAAIPVWIAFIPYSFALGITAKAYGLHLGEILLMSALVYSGTAQFAVLEPLGSGKPTLQILITAFLMNLRFLPMSAALVPYFRRVKRATILFCSQFISASSFILAYAYFQKDQAAKSGDDNHRYFLGVGLTNFSVWVLGSGIGYWVALRVPQELDEGLKFIVPGYFACMLATEAYQRIALLICAASFFAALPAALLNPHWGWLVTAFIIATVGWGLEEWTKSESS